MKALSAAALLRHRDPALVVGMIETCTPEAVRCRSRGPGPWAWPQLLEGAVQTAGLLAGQQPGGPSNSAVVAEYRDLAVHRRAHAGPVCFEARLDRRLLHFWRCRVAARADDGTLLLEGAVTLAPGARGPDAVLRPLAVPPPDAHVQALLAEAGFGSDLFNARQHRSCELVERYALHLAIALVDRLGLRALLTAPRTVDELLHARSFVPAFRPALRWLLARLAAAGVLRRDEGDGERRYVLPAPLPRAQLDALRAAGLDSAPAYAPSYALLDEAAALYPRVARGETTGERALLLRATLWSAYFSNANEHYAINNRVTADVAARRLADGAAILELGAGLGSATEALLEALAARGRLGSVGSYRVTEPVPFFRRRAERALTAASPGLPLVFAPLDIDAPWADQGVVSGAWQLVWGVNVFHVARDLHAALREAFTALAPGGWIVLGEGLRPAPDEPVGAELPFQLLESFTAVQTDPERRPTPGFLTAEHWRQALTRAGFAAVESVPDAARIRPFYPGLLAAAVCGRRP